MPLAAVGMGLLDPCVTVLSLKHSQPHRQGHTTSALQTNMNLGQVAVLGLASAVLNACLALGAGHSAGTPRPSRSWSRSRLVAVLAGRARAV